ncbi:hypothetical protein EJD97_011997 [Solanum chilense]|uniref:non-specific serine/threonine protein kinase n=1 Tax=Solanum chilense TaxID=4083 RepID=A0A6N2BG67_SOLCI|nr:hypothetical protein EJD97_011997 [Solanum chilense]
MIFFQENRSFELVLGLLVLNILWVGVKSQCSDDCDALASFYVWNGANLTFMSNTFSTPIKNILSYNPQITNPDIIRTQSRVNVPFSCSCVDGKFMGHQFDVQVKTSTTYPRITRLYCSNLTTVEKLQESNSYDPNNVPVNSIVKVIVNCSCGNSHVSKDYGLFITYPLRPGENLVTLANDFSLPQKLLEDYNPEANFSSGSGLVFIPGKAQKVGLILLLQRHCFQLIKSEVSKSSECDCNLLKTMLLTGFSGGAITGISVAVVLVVALLAVCIYITFYRGRKTEENLNLEPYKHSSNKHVPGHANFENSSEGGSLKQGASPEVPRIAVDKSIEFSYDELAKASDNFSTAYKIGQGGFASVYYGELRGEKAAIKKMDMQATKEFLAELKVLTHVHHLNLVRLIGYCIEGSLFLVYEYIENGNLSQHLRGSVPGKVPLPWSTRVKIALDAARGLEYIHEHTVPVYIHRDIKTANILIDKNFRAKVADFGLTKLIETEGGSMNTRLVGTFGYMAPEYGQFGDVSLKIDVYAFGVVLYELISARKAIIKTSEIATESKGLVGLFEDVLNEVDPKEGICKLVDPKLGDDYPLDSVWNVALLAKACTQENPRLRPSMRSIVVALMTISSTSANWNLGEFYENQGLAHLISGR